MLEMVKGGDEFGTSYNVVLQQDGYDEDEHIRLNVSRNYGINYLDWGSEDDNAIWIQIKNDRRGNTKDFTISLVQAEELMMALAAIKQAYETRKDA